MMLTQAFFVAAILGGFMPSAFAQTDLQDPIEEVVAVGIDRCGPWPLAHVSSLSLCEFAVLKQSERASWHGLRDKLARACLVCDSGACRLAGKQSNRETERDALHLCERIFLTPIKIRPMSGSGSVVPEKRPVYVDFTYSIARDGSVRDIKLIAKDRHSTMSDNAMRGMLKRAARRVRFEPLVMDGVRWKIVEIHDRYRLDGN